MNDADFEAFICYSFLNVKEEFERFTKAYRFERIFLATAPATSLKPPHLRVCRFCKKSYGETSFKSKAHVMPELIGNHSLISDFECDSCNSLFAGCEDNFAISLGILRTIAGTQGKVKPKFKSAREIITSKDEDFYGRTVTKISKDESMPGAIKVDSVTGETTITYHKGSYTPVKVYKALLKIALCMINEEELLNYQALFDFLLNRTEAEWISSFAKVIYHQMPNSIERLLHFVSY